VNCNTLKRFQVDFYLNSIEKKVKKQYNIDIKFGGLRMPKIVNEEIKEFVKIVQQLLGTRLKKIILYGSYARGDYNRQSDVDIMILTDLSFEEIEDYRDRISDIAYDIELNTGIILSPIIKNIDKYNSKVNFVPFYKNVQKEGVVLVNE